VRTPWLLSLVWACAGGGHNEATTTAPPQPPSSSLTVPAEQPAPSSAASEAPSATPTEPASGRCEDRTWWLAYLVTLAKSSDPRKLAFVARQTSARSEEVHQAENALAQAAAGHDAAARDQAISNADAMVAKNRPACARPFSLVPPKRHATDAGAVNGWLPPAVIQHVVRSNFGRVKLCYEAALRSDPSTGGRIETKFRIALDGTVSSAVVVSSRDAGAPDALHECVRGVFKALTFPPPEGGVVTIIYPLILSPGTD